MVWGILALLYSLTVIFVFEKMRKALGYWVLFPVVVIPMLVAGLIAGFGSWWSNSEFWGWFFVSSFFLTLPIALYFQFKKEKKASLKPIFQEVQGEKLEVFSQAKKSEGMELFPDDLILDEKKEEENLKELAKKVEEVITYENLKEHIVGQDYALTLIEYAIKGAIKELLSGNQKREKILSSFLLVGTTGVGKTETAKAVAKLLEPLGYEFLRVDMNQFRDEHSIWTLLGSPRGYLGSEKGGYLTNALKENPKRVILFDEVEKAHPDVMSFLLQFLDEGYVIERESGKRYEPLLSVVFFTSNFSAKEIGEIARNEPDEIQRELKIRKILEGFFAPEFLGRLDEVVPYRPLSFEDLVEIARRELKKYGAEDRAREFAEKYYSLANEYGVRFFLKKIVREVVRGEKGMELFD